MSTNAPRFEIRQFPCLADNFGVLIHLPDSGHTVAFDVPAAGPYLDALEETGWKLTDILITHHHWDHVEGLSELKKATGAKVTAPKISKGKIADVDAYVEDGDKVMVGDLEFHAVGTPGHTLDQISWWAPAAKFAHTGDTLFSAGCGRVMEGDMEMMSASLEKLARMLPGDTNIYCGHEYTTANVKFALTVDADNPALADRAKEVAELRDAGKSTLPTTMERELATNPFLRTSDASIQKAIGKDGATPAEVFAELRTRKDNFRG